MEDMDMRAIKEQFSVHGDPQLEENKKQGTLWLSLPLQFIQPAEFIIRYFTCEGRYSYLHAIHFKILNGLRHGDHPMNLPSFLYNIIKRQVSYVQQVKT